MSQGEGGGRPKIVLTPDQIREVETLSAVLSQPQIADYLGIAQRTFEAILARDEDVYAAYKRGKARAIQRVAASLIEKAVEGNAPQQIFYLKTQGGWKEQAPEQKELPPLTINVVDATPK
jgi:DNA-binding CsgD family transcriptional regulator